MLKKHSHRVRPTLLALALASALSLAACGGGGSSSSDNVTSVAPTPKTAKNVILMISDGASYNAWEMAANWQQGAKANELDEYRNLNVRLGMTTFPLNTESAPTNDNTAMVSYDAAKAWDPTVEATKESVKGKYETAIAAYKYLRLGVTDSAAAATALASGQKTYNNAINYNNFGQPIEYITQIAKRQGKATGVVTSVQLSHATPAGFGAQNISRNNYAEIAQDMLGKGTLDLVMGTGNPEFDDNGKPVDPAAGKTPAQCDADATCKAAHKYVGGAVYWDNLKKGSLKPGSSLTPWKLIQSKADFEALAQGKLDVKAPLVGIPPVAGTLQQSRKLEVLGADASQPSGVKQIETVPTLATMTKGALNYLGKEKKGMFLMIEGGAVDWASHANQSDRIVEEQVDFNNALAAVQDWVAKNSNWDETLLIVTTDHGNSLPLGMDSDVKAFSPTVSKGQNKVPDARYWTNNHTNEVVRLWARGQGADKLKSMATKKDARFAEVVGHNNDGSYLDNTEIFTAMKAAYGL